MKGLKLTNHQRIFGDSVSKSYYTPLKKIS